MTDDELLTPKSAPANTGLREQVLDRTARRVRIVWRLRMGVRALFCLLCFAAGAATTFLRPAPDPQMVYVEIPAAPGADGPGSPPQTPSVVRAPSPAELELEAEKAPVKADSARLFREAGDRYMLDYSDYRAALRCYRNFLDGADADARIISADDTWLLTSLKRARAQENTR